MPELPEVQTIISDLNRKIKGDTVVDFWSDWKKSIKMPFEKFKKDIKDNVPCLVTTAPAALELTN